MLAGIARCVLGCFLVVAVLAHAPAYEGVVKGELGVACALVVDGNAAMRSAAPSPMAAVPGRALRAEATFSILGIAGSSPRRRDDEAVEHRPSVRVRLHRRRIPPEDDAERAVPHAPLA